MNLTAAEKKTIGKQIVAIRSSGCIRMIDIHKVHEIAQERGYVALCALIEQDPNKYALHILTGLWLGE
ncbi:DUF5049 domain-containing protein [uncultured Dialister sp.]|uniref:DUF5049 domain-containing protein n=1 Tax=uncultured Dialister sp. TaxID=278064 RepID=UPI00265E76D9|nr:DUF5049 domain-containing protein [uncultured Dialister sp.]